MTLYSGLLYMLVQTFANLVMVSHLKGCLDSTCSKLCKLGVADCSGAVPICEFGYFLFKQQHCVRCPGINTNLQLSCMDCIENPTTFDNTRQCSYSYLIEDGDAVYGIYIKQNDLINTLYFVDASFALPSQTSERQIDLPYEAQICEGCQEFCNDVTDESCNLFENYDNIIDPQFGVICQNGYYFNEDNCIKCSATNCIDCLDDECKMCQSGYALHSDGRCKPCFDGCLQCAYDDYDEMECYKCQYTELKDYYIPSKFLTECISCGQYCVRCEYVTYDQSIYPTYLTRDLSIPYDEDVDYYIARCRQCSDDNKFISANGIDCMTCRIDNCQQCFQDLGDGVTTMDNDFTPKDADIAIQCYQCKVGYELSADKKSCTAKAIDQNCQTFDSDGSCQLCANGLMYDMTTNTCTTQVCSTKIINCLDCFSYDEPDQDTSYDQDGNPILSNKKQLQCIKCKSGFYADFFTGKCTQCQSNCQTCSQYTDTYNLTSINSQYTIYSQTQKSQFLNEEMNDLMCTKCLYGYDLYSNKCQGCGDGCLIDQESKCQFDYDKAYCSQCPAGLKSLISDNSDCADCPKYCLACRERTIDEINAINPLFKPQNIDFLKYSNLCYDIMDNFISTKNLYLDTITFMPTACDYPNTSKKCYYTATIETDLVCDTTFDGDAIDLESIFKGKAQIASLFLRTVEKYSNYLLLNQNAVQQLTITINVHGSKCIFSKPTKFTTSFQQNVFSLMKLNIHFKSTSEVIFSQVGQLYFKNINQLLFENISFQYFDEKKKNKQFGIIFLGKSSSFTLTKSIINKDVTISQDYSQFSFNFSGINNIILDDVKFNKLQSIDQFLIQNFTIESKYTLQLNKIEFTDCEFINNKKLFTSNLLNYSSITVTDIKLYKSIFTNTSFFGNDISNELAKISLSIDKFQIILCLFNQSSIISTNLIVQSQIQNFDVIWCQFISSYILRLNHINLKNLYFKQNNFYNNSKAISTTQSINIEVVPKSLLQQFSIMNAQFESNLCSTLNCLIVLSTPQNSYNVQAKLILHAIQISNTNMYVYSDDMYYVNSALCVFKLFEDIDMSQIKLISNLGTIVMYFDQIKSIDIDTFQCDSVQEEYEYIIYPDESEIQIENPYNNQIPVSDTCTDELVNSNNYNFYCLYIDEFSHGIRMNNIILSNLLLVDFNSIVISSYDILRKNTTRSVDTLQKFYSNYQNEIIIFQNIYAFNNTLVVYELGTESSLIQIKSSQQQQIQILNSQFQSNHMHKSSLQQIMNSATIFVIDSVQAHVKMEYLTYEYNRATEINFGLNLMIVSSINLNYCYFMNTNIFDAVWIHKLGENQMNQQQQRQFFSVKSKGSNLFIQATSIYINNSKFINSFGLDGAGLYIESQGNGQIQINNTIFNNVQSDLDSKYLTSGGCIYIDALTSSLNLYIFNVEMDNCIARNKGGCIFIGSSKNQQLIDIENSKFSRCQSLLSQVIDISFFDVVNQITIFSNVKIIDNNIIQFLSKIPLLTNAEINQYKQQSALITQINGQMQLNNIDISNIQRQSLISANNLYKGDFNKIQIINNTIFSAPFLQITIKENIGTLYFGSIQFANNTQYWPLIQYKYQCNLLFFQIPYQQIEQQTCDKWLDNIQLVDATVNDDLYDLTYYNYNKILSNQEKYDWEQINNIVQNSYYDKIIEYTYNQEVADCIFDQISYEINNQSTAYVKLQNIQYGNKVIIESFQFNNNYCSKCIYGLFQILNVFQEKNLIQINQLICNNNKLSYFGCLSITKNEQQYDIEFNKKLYGRILSENLNDEYTIVMTNSKFLNNQAQIGSGLMIQNLNILIKQCEFSNNVAQLVGAGLFYQAYQSYIQIFNSIFRANKAQQGSAIYLDNTQLSNQTKSQNLYEYNIGTSTYEDPIALTITINYLQLLTKQFNNYTNEFGDVISQDIDMIDEINIQQIDQLNYGNSDYLILPSGQKINDYKYFYKETMEQIPFNWNMKLVYLNRFGEILKQEYSSDQCIIDGRIQNESNYDIKQQYLTNFTNLKDLYYDVVDGSFDLKDLIITFDPYIDDDLYLELRIQCQRVKKPVQDNLYPYNVIGMNNNYQLLVKIKTFPCQLGEAYSDQQCKACDANQKKFNVVIDQSECQEMDDDKMLDVTPVGVNLKKGWYRPYYDNDQFEYCQNLPANCNGGWIAGNPSCYTGHIGALCESCDLYGQFNDIRYSNTEKYICSPCKETEDSSIGILVGNTLATVASITLSVKGTYEIVNQFLMVKSLTLMGVRFNQNANQLATLIKMLTNYFQIIQIVNSFQLVLPKGLTKTTDAAGNPTKSSSFSLDCILQPMTDINMIYFRMIWALVMPCIYLLIYFVQYFIGVMSGKIPYKAPMISTAFIYMFIFAQPTLVGGFIQLASSRLVSGITWVQADVAYRSDTDDHQLWVGAFAAPMIIIWVLLLPLLLLYRIYTYRFHLHNTHVRSRWGFFYNEYETSAYYWEFVKIFQKELMVIFLTFYEDYVLIKGALVILVLLYYLWIQINTRPYANNDLNYIDRFSTVVCIITLVIGLIIYTSQQYDTLYLIIIMFILLGILNIIFLLQIVFKIFEGYLIKLSDKIDPIKDKIVAIKPSMLYTYPSLRKLLKNNTKTQIKVNQLWCVLRNYTKEQIQNGRNGQPKFEVILNAKYDFEAAKLPRDPSAMIVPQLDEQMPDFLNSGMPVIAKSLFDKIDLTQQQQNNNKSGQKDEQKKEKEEGGFLGGLKQYMPASIKKQIEQGEKKLDEAKKMKEQAENAVSKAKQIAGVKDNKQHEEEESQRLKQEEEEEQNQEKGGFFGQMKSFLPDSVKDSIKKAEEQKKQMEQKIQEAQNLKDKLEKTAQGIQQGNLSSLNQFVPPEIAAQLQKAEEEKKKIEQKIQEAQNMKDKLEKTAQGIQQGNLSSLNQFIPPEIAAQIQKAEEEKKKIEEQIKQAQNLANNGGNLLDAQNKIKELNEQLQEKQKLLENNASIEQQNFEEFKVDAFRVTQSNFNDFAQAQKK